MSLTFRIAGRILPRRTPPSFLRTPPRRLQSTSTSSSSSTNRKVSTVAAPGLQIPVPNTVATLPLWQRLGPLTTAFSAYGRSQRKNPYRTQFLTSLVIYMIGDITAQKINGDEYEPLRTSRALVISAGSSIPSYLWFLWLGNHFNYPSKILSLATKVVVNQAFFTPVFNTYFFGMQSFLSGDSLKDVWERIKATVPTSIKNSCKLWPAVTAFSFTYVPAEYRNLFGSVIAIGWQAYLSFLNRRAEVDVAGHKGMVEVLQKEERKRIEGTSSWC